MRADSPSDDWDLVHKIAEKMVIVGDNVRGVPENSDVMVMPDGERLTGPAVSMLIKLMAVVGETGRALLTFGPRGDDS